MCVEQVPRFVIIGIGFDEVRNRGRRFLDSLADPVRFQQDFSRR
jgi:hypothetical protein